MLRRFQRFLLAMPAMGAILAQPVEWPAYSGSHAGTRFSALHQINRKNVRNLKRAWTFHTGMVKGRLSEKAAFETTPIVAAGTMYVITPDNRVFALDPESGREKWRVDPEVNANATYSEVTSRGVSYWNDRKAPEKAACKARIFLGTIDARLIALDASTGARCDTFGKSGTVDLTEGMTIHDRGDYQVTTPPAVVKDIVVVGSSVGDNGRFDREKGTVRGFDARSGKLVWSWDPLPPSLESGAANAWSGMAADERLGLVFIPTGSASPDFYGGRRKGDNRWANSVVALRASTGKFVWGFQVVHHDLWDYDVASQPALVTVGSTPAVLVATKMGRLFLLHRETGKPLWPVEEMPVAKTDIEGEESSPTQPMPVSASVSPQRFHADDLWGMSGSDRKWCADQFAKVRNEGIFTPPSLRGSLLFPGNVGGVNWGSMAVDERAGLAIMATNRVATIVRLIPRSDFANQRRAHAESRLGGEFGTQAGTPYGMYRFLFASPGRMPCNKPPWGTLTAVDLRTGKQKWEVPLGEMRIPGTEMVIRGLLNLGGPLATAGGLVFIAATVGEDALRAFDAATGELLWKAELPAGGQANPMTFRGRNGRQYVVISAGGHGKAKTKAGDYVIAYVLP